MKFALLTHDLMIVPRVDGIVRDLNCSLEQVLSLENLQSSWKELPADVVLIDLMLPGLDIECVANWIRSQGINVTLIAFVPHVHTQKIKLAQDVGCDQVYARGEFLSQIRAIISQCPGNHQQDPLA